MRWGLSPLRVSVCEPGGVREGGVESGALCPHPAYWDPPWVGMGLPAVCQLFASACQGVSPHPNLRILKPISAASPQLGRGSTQTFSWSESLPEDIPIPACFRSSWSGGYYTYRMWSPASAPGCSEDAFQPWTQPSPLTPAVRAGWHPLRCQVACYQMILWAWLGGGGGWPSPAILVTAHTS